MSVSHSLVDKGSSMIHQRIEKKDFVPNNNQKSELTPTERILKPVKFIAVEANLFSSSGDGKAPQNVVKGMLSSSKLPYCFLRCR